MKRVLFIGNPDNELLKNLAIELRKVDSTLQIDFLSATPFLNRATKTVYSNTFTPESQSRWLQIRIIKFFAIWYILRSQIGRIPHHYDAVHVFYVTPVLGFLRFKVQALSKKLIVSIFGSEFYRSGKVLRWLVFRFIRRAQLITAANESTLNDVLAYYKLVDIPVKVIPFGVKTLDIINSISADTLEHTQKKLGIDDNKINIAVGYNGFPIQQHEAILASIEKSGLSQRTDLCFVFQLNGAGPLEYKSKLIDKISKSVSNYLIFDKFLSDQELAVIRMSIDVMIQLQKTDQLSASMLEYMYSGAIVITGAWLPYDMLSKQGFYFFKIEHIDDIGEKLNEILTNIVIEKSLSVVNKEKVWDLTNWAIKAKQWHSLYRV
ncbi:MAG: hypothetical protein IM638_12130 [Bacteroidetes bacterium]|nr:hypothetical protein [Bacteroidota bacterium]